MFQGMLPKFHDLFRPNDLGCLHFVPGPPPLNLKRARHAPHPLEISGACAANLDTGLEYYSKSVFGKVASRFQSLPEVVLPYPAQQDRHTPNQATGWAIRQICGANTYPLVSVHIGCQKARGLLGAGFAGYGKRPLRRKRSWKRDKDARQDTNTRVNPSGLGDAYPDWPAKRPHDGGSESRKLGAGAGAGRQMSSFSYTWDLLSIPRGYHAWKKNLKRGHKGHDVLSYLGQTTPYGPYQVLCPLCRSFHWRFKDRRPKI
jgi:hypothetical protein